MAVLAIGQKNASKMQSVCLKDVKIITEMNVEVAVGLAVEEGDAVESTLKQAITVMIRNQSLRD